LDLCSSGKRQPSIATRTIDPITDKFALFSRFPHIGKSLEPDLRPTTRTFPLSNYLIFYSAKPAEIPVLRILHASRDLQSIRAIE
jgi:toxin ParE1/3/4